MAGQAPLGEMIIELSIDSQDFGKSLRSSKNEVKFWANGMKAGMQSAENAGKNLVKMKTNVDGLTKTIEAQRKVVARLKDSYEGSFNKATGEATQQTERYAYQLRQAEGQLESYEADLKQATRALAEYEARTTGVTGKIDRMSKKMQEAGKRFQTIGDGMRDVGDSLTAGLTVPLAAGAGYAIKSASDYETAFTNVKKVTDEIVDSNGNVVYSYEELSDGIRQLSKEIPLTQEELAGLAAQAGRFGVEADNILEFTEVMGRLGASIDDFPIEEASEQMAKFLNVTGSGTDTVSNLASALVELGNNTATSERDILSLATRWASTGALIGLTDAQILAFSATLSEMGAEAEAGGSSMQRLSHSINNAVAGGGSGLQGFAKVAGMSADEFAAAWEERPAEALQAFLKGLDEVDKSGGNVNQILSELGINSTRDLDAILKLAGGHEKLAKNLDLSTDAYEANTALMDESEAAFDTFQAKLTIVRNKVRDVGIEIGGPLLDALSSALDASEPFLNTIADLATKFADAGEGTQRLILGFLGIAAAAGPVLSVGGRLLSGGGKLIEVLGNIGQFFVDRKVGQAGKRAMEEIADGADLATGSLGDVTGKADEVGDSLEDAGQRGGAGAASFINPWTLGIATVAGLSAAFYWDITSANREHEKAVNETDGAYQTWFDGVVEGQAKIEEMNQSAIQGAHDTMEAYKEAIGVIKDQNEAVMGLAQHSFGNSLENALGIGTLQFNADINQDGQVVNYRMENLQVALDQMGVASGRIKEIKEEVMLFQNQIGNSFAEVAKHFSEGSVVTHEWADSIISSFDTASEATISRLQEMKQAEIEKIQSSKSLSEADKEQHIQAINEKYDSEIQAVQEAQSTISDILSTASQENRALTEEEVLSMIEAFQQLSQSTGQSLHEMDEVAQFVGDNLSSLTSQAGLEFLQTAGMIDEATVLAVANADTAEEKVRILNEALDQYSGKEPAYKDFQSNADEMTTKLEQLGYTVHTIDGQTVVIPTDTSAPLTEEEVNQLGLQAVTVNGRKVYIPSNTNSKATEKNVGQLKRGAKDANGTRVNIPSSTNADETKRKVNETRNAARDKTFTITGIVNWWQGSRLNPGNWETGTMYHPGGLSMVNDQAGSYFRELVQLPTGQSFIPQGRNVLLDLPRGSKVMKASKTMQAFPGLPQYAEGIGNISMDSPIIQDYRRVTTVGANNNEFYSMHEVVTLLKDLRDEVQTFRESYDPNKVIQTDDGTIIGKYATAFGQEYERQKTVKQRRV